MRRSTLVVALALMFGALASGYALAATVGGSSSSAKPIPTITVAPAPPLGTPPSSVPQHNVTVPGLGRATAAFRRGATLLARDRYVGRATNGQRLIFVRADPWTAGKGSSLVGVTMVITVASPIVGARWLPTVSHTDSKNQHLTSDPNGDVYNVKWVHLDLEHVTRFWALIDFRKQRVASLLPVIPDEKPPYHLVNPANLNSNISATPPP
jgi:hypothetical protein